MWQEIVRDVLFRLPRGTSYLDLKLVASGAIRPSNEPVESIKSIYNFYRNEFRWSLLLGSGYNLMQTCRRIGVTRPTFYRWRQGYGLKPDQVKRFRQMERFRFCYPVFL